MGNRGVRGPQDKSLAAFLLSLPSLLSPSAVFTPLAAQRLHSCLALLRWLWPGVRGEGGLPRLLASSSLNSRLGTQDGPARSPRRRGLHRRSGLGSALLLAELFLGFSHGPCSDGCPLEREGAAEEGCGVQPSPLRGTRGSPSRAGFPSGEQLPGWSRADLLQNLGRPRMGFVESKEPRVEEELGDSGCKWKGRGSRMKTWVVGKKGEKRGEENLSGASVTTPFPR